MCVFTYIYTPIHINAHKRVLQNSWKLHIIEKPCMNLKFVHQKKLTVAYCNMSKQDPV